MTNTQFAVFLNNIDNGIVSHHVKHDPNGMKVLSQHQQLTQRKVLRHLHVSVVRQKQKQLKN